MICDQVRPLLPEHLLGSLEATSDAAVVRHLRGCASCRGELAKLEEGLAALATATHDRTPPDELRDRVLDVLSEEWRGTVTMNGPDRRRSVWLVAAAFVLLIATAAWGVAQSRRADLAGSDATSYRTLLATLGGEDFHVGRLHASNGHELSGEVLLYEGDSADAWDSWGVVIAHAPGRVGEATATLVAPGGDTMALPSLGFSEDGDAWIMFSMGDDVARYDRITITAPGDGLIGTGEIRSA